MDDLLLLLILDHISGGAYRSVVNFVGIVIVIAGFLAHPIIGVVLLLVWVVIALALAIPSTAWKVVGISAGTLVLLVAGSALLMRP